MPTKPIISALLAIPMLAALACAPAAAQDQPELDARVEEQLGIKLPLPDRPVLAGGRLVCFRSGRGITVPMHSA